MRTLAAVVVTLTFSAAVASAASPGSGLYGIVMRGPITPVCRTGVPCDAPAASLVLTFVGSQITKTTRTDRRGRYRIALPAGVYAMRTSAKPFGRIPRPAKVHVRSGRFDRITFTIDTGIR